MSPVEIGLALAALGAIVVAAALAHLLHTARQDARLLENNDAALRATIATLETRAITRALDTVKLETDKAVDRLPGETINAFSRRADLEAMKGRDGILSAVLATGHIHETIDIHNGGNTARILHTLKVTK